MKIIRDEKGQFGFPFIAYIPENVSDHPALLIQLHGAGERGDGGDELDKVWFTVFPRLQVTAISRIAF